MVKAEQSKDKKGVGNESLADIQGRMTNTRLNSQAISDMDDIREQMRQLRESCLRYLMQIFFPDKYKADSFETTEQTGNIAAAGSNHIAAAACHGEQCPSHEPVLF